MREREAVRRSVSMHAEDLVQLLDRLDAWRRRERFELMLLACDCIERAEATQAPTRGQPTHARLRQALRRAAAVDTGGVASLAALQGLRGPAIAAAVHAARVHAVDADLNEEPND